MANHGKSLTYLQDTATSSIRATIKNLAASTKQLRADEQFRDLMTRIEKTELLK